MKNVQNKLLLKAILWLVVAVSAACGTFVHFKYGSTLWAITDIPFVLLIAYGFVGALRDYMFFDNPQ